MAATKLINTIELNQTWTEVTMGTAICGFLVAVKASSYTPGTDAYDPKSVSSINIDVGVDSGVTNKPVTINHLTLNFNAETSDDESLNKITALAQIVGYPSTFYIKVKSFVAAGKTITKQQSTTAISINISK